MDSKACSCSTLMIQWIPIPTTILLGVCCFFGFGFDHFFTSIALISSTALFVYSRQMRKKTVLKSNEHETPAQQIKDDDDDDDDDEELEEDRNGVITSEDSEVEWPFTENGEDQSLDFSDEGSISDEDSLIEIAIPTGHYVGYKQRMPNKMVDFSTESIFQRSNVMDDEDNLIEIDISMGLIKCSRF